jgi:cytochrome c oxidase assembly protein subunit 15
VVGSALVARVRGRTLTPETFRRVAVASAGWLYLIILSGATVRLTASGLGCEHWPGCTPTNFAPSKSYHSFIEFGNRIVSAFTIIATLVAAVAAYATPALPRWARWLAYGTFAGTLAQAPLGAITVYSGLNPYVVMTHFLLALVVLAGGVVLAVVAVALERGTARSRLPLLIRRGSLVAAAALLALVLTGMISTAAGPHPGGTDEPVRRLWRLHAAVYTHVRATAIFGALFLAFLVWIHRNRARWPLYAESAGVVLILLIAQMAVGELQYRSHLPWWLVLVHVGLAAAVWASAVALVAAIRRPPEPFEARGP